MKDKVRVRCKYNDGFDSCIMPLDEVALDSWKGCRKMYGENASCRQSFYIDWVNFLICKRHLIEIDEGKDE